MVFDKAQIGMPVAEIEKGKSDAETVELWPLIQAYGLDSKWG